ncbi:MAG: hypothetical protein WD187_04260 [Candidatus Woykebacteria bacterium]
MRGLLAVLVFLFFGLTFPIAVFTYAVTTVVNPSYVKSQLGNSEIYEVAADQIPNLIDREEEHDEKRVKDPTEEKFKKIILQEVDGKYLQSKVEPFVDDTFSWLARERQEPPQISFADLAERAEKLVKQPLPTDIEKTLSEPFKLEPDNANAIKDWYRWFTLTPLIFGIISVLLLVGLFLLVKGWRSRLRRVALAIFLPTFFGFLGVGVGLFLGRILSGIASGLVADSRLPDLQVPVEEIVVSISEDITRTLLIIYAVALVVAIILFISSFFVDRESRLSKEAVDKK